LKKVGHSNSKKSSDTQDEMMGEKGGERGIKLSNWRIPRRRRGRDDPGKNEGLLIGKRFGERKKERKREMGTRRQTWTSQEVRKDPGREKKEKFGREKVRRLGGGG